MYNTSFNERHQSVRGGVLIKGENYWPVKLRHRSTGHTKSVNLHSDEPTVQAFLKETMENATKPNRWRNYCSDKELGGQYNDMFD